MTQEFRPVNVRVEIELTGIQSDRDLLEWATLMEMSLEREWAEEYEIDKENVSVMVDIEEQRKG